MHVWLRILRQNKFWLNFPLTVVSCLSFVKGDMAFELIQPVFQTPAETLLVAQSL
jgi:hypothetical protein